MRLEPRNPLLWYQLALIRYEQNEYVHATQFAMKSNSYAGNDVRLQARNWRLIARSREQNGDFAGAVAATEKAERLALDR